MNRPRRVAIVGAGPAGLVAAKTLLRDHPAGTFEATVFEGRSCIGGLWPLHRDDVRPHSVNPEMRTNLSRFTVCFSDLAWESVKPEGTLGRDGGRDMPMFPKAWHVGRYLTAYAEKYIPENSIKLNCKVTSVVRGKSQDGLRWRLQWVNSASKNASAENLNGEPSPHEDELKSNSADFDFLIVASGFFSRPLIPDIPGLKDFPGIVMHSANLGTIEDLLYPKEASTGHGSPMQQIPRFSTNNAGEIPKKIVVIGGSMSGAEAAGSLALQLSSAKHSPHPPKEISDHTIFHITTRPFWALPPFIPSDPTVKETNEFNSTPSFLPLDLVMFDIARRHPSELAGPTVLISAERARKTNDYFKTLIGSNQSDLGSDALTIEGEAAEKPPWIGISEGYSEFVRDGLIRARPGRVKKVNKASDGSGSVTVSGEGEVTLENVTALVLATGYEARHSLNFLPSDILETLEYQPNSNFVPILLERNSTIHPSLPDLGFVGFYRGPYWGAMEMQSRFLAQFWADEGNLTLSPSPDDSPDISLMRTLRASPTQKGQFPMSDYVGVMLSFRETIHTPWQPLPNTSRGQGLVVPSRYSPIPIKDPDVETTLSALAATVTPTSPPRFLARATFRALQGTWSVHRQLTSALPAFPSGTFTGTASFHPRTPTEENGNGELYEAEYLYIEDGELLTREGLRLKASRRYVYRYREATDKISVWFVKAEDGKSVDYFFHELEFLPLEAAGGGEDGGGWKAKGSYHLCVEDEYESSYRFLFQGVGARKWTVAYKVRGPKKDYVTETWYQR